jgi:hypothetical protein
LTSGGEPVVATSPQEPILGYRRGVHLEQDRPLLPPSRRSQRGEDLWYWAKLSPRR